MLVPIALCFQSCIDGRLVDDAHRRSIVSGDSSLGSVDGSLVGDASMAIVDRSRRRRRMQHGRAVGVEAAIEGSRRIRWLGQRTLEYWCRSDELVCDVGGERHKPRKEVRSLAREARWALAIIRGGARKGEWQS